MRHYEVKLADGRLVEMTGTDATHACERAADLHGAAAVAWRHARRQEIRVGMGDER